MEKIQQVINAAEGMLEEGNLSKNVTEGLKQLVAVLKKSDDVSLVKEKCLHELESLSNNENLDSYIRTQLWDLVALLERL